MENQPWMKQLSVLVGLNLKFCVLLLTSSVAIVVTCSTFDGSYGWHRVGTSLHPMASFEIPSMEAIYMIGTTLTSATGFGAFIMSAAVIAIYIYIYACLLKSNDYSRKIVNCSIIYLPVGV